MNDSALITRIQRYCLHDGSGTRTTLFFKGCPLHCRWCHNPENIESKPEILFTESRCIHCGCCVRVCSKKPNGPECTRCGRCVEACPTGARDVSGKWYSVNELLQEIRKVRLFYEQSGGGVTFSGGEPMLQFSFLQQILPTLREEEIPVALDTCGYAPTNQLLQIASCVDLILYDLKLVNPVLHKEYTATGNELILSNLQALCKHSQDSKRHQTRIWIRVPIIPGVNDSPEEVQAFCQVISSLLADVVQQVNLLPYHRIGVEKYRRVGRSYTLRNTVEPTSAQMEELRRVFQQTQFPILLGG